LGTPVPLNELLLLPVTQTVPEGASKDPLQNRSRLLNTTAFSAIVIVVPGWITNAEFCAGTGLQKHNNNPANKHQPTHLDIKCPLRINMLIYVVLIKK